MIAVRVWRSQFTIAQMVPRMEFVLSEPCFVSFQGDKYSRQIRARDV